MLIDEAATHQGVAKGRLLFKPPDIGLASAALWCVYRRFLPHLPHTGYFSSSCASFPEDACRLTSIVTMAGSGFFLIRRGAAIAADNAGRIGPPFSSRGRNPRPDVVSRIWESISSKFCSFRTCPKKSTTKGFG